MKKTLLFAIVIFASIAANAQKPKVDTSQVYTSVDKPPKFPGGSDKFMEYVNRSLKGISRKDNKSGMVVVVSVVEKDGTFSSCKAVKSLNAESDSIAIAIVSRTPQWIPATKNNQPVRCKYAIPVRFGNPDPKTLLQVKEPEN